MHAQSTVASLHKVTIVSVLLRLAVCIYKTYIKVYLISVGYYFSTCGNPIGPFGPINQHCQDAYKDTNVSVAIGHESKSETYDIGYVTGIQRWRVPKTGLYT